MDRYGELPKRPPNLIAVARFRVAARAAGLTDVALQGNFIKFCPGATARIQGNAAAAGCTRARMVKAALDAVLVPKPKTARIGGRDLADGEVLAWAQNVLDAIFSD